MSELGYPYLRYKLNSMGNAAVLFQYTIDNQDGVQVLDEADVLGNDNTIAFGSEILGISGLVADAKAGNNIYHFEADIGGDFTITTTINGTNTIVLSQDITLSSIAESADTLTITVNNDLGDGEHVVTITGAASYTYQVGNDSGLTLQTLLANYGDGYEEQDTTLLNPGYNILQISDLATAGLKITDDNADDASYTLLTAPAEGVLSLDGTTLNKGDSFTFQDLADGLVRLDVTDTNDFTSFNLLLKEGEDEADAAIAFSLTPSFRTPYSPLNTKIDNIENRLHQTEAELITTGDGADTITTGSGDDVVEAGRGDDIINLGDDAANEYNGADEVVYRINSIDSVAFDGGDVINGFHFGQDVLTFELYNANVQNIDEYLASKDFTVRFNHEFDGGVAFITGLDFIFPTAADDGNGVATNNYFVINFVENIAWEDFVVDVVDESNIDYGNFTLKDLSVLPNILGEDNLRLVPLSVEAENLNQSYINNSFLFVETDGVGNKPVAVLSISDGRNIGDYTVSVVAEDKGTNNDDDFYYDTTTQRLFLNGTRANLYGDGKIEQLDVTITLSRGDEPDLILTQDVRVDIDDRAPVFSAGQELILVPDVDYSAEASVLGTIIATDINGDEITYSIKEVALEDIPNSNLLADFSIDENSGAVSYNGTGVDESLGDYSITITATSNISIGGVAVTTDEVIDLTFNAPTELASTPPSGAIIESGTNQSGMSSTSNDGGFSITDGLDSAADIKLYALAGDNSDDSLADPTENSTEITLNDSVDSNTIIDGTYGYFTFTRASNGEITGWQYNLDDADADTEALSDGSTVTETARVIAIDDSDVVSMVADLDIDITGSNDAPVLSFLPAEVGSGLISTGGELSGNVTHAFRYSAGGTHDNLARLVDGDKSIRITSLFQPTAADRDHVTITFDAKYRGGEVAVYNRLSTTGSGQRDYINNSEIEFRLDGAKVGDTYVLDRNDVVGDGGETQNYASFLAYANSNYSREQDFVLVVTPPEDLIFDAVRVIFDGDEQNIREIEVYGRGATTQIDEGTIGTVQNWQRLITDAEGHSFTAGNLSIYEADGEKSDRFDVALVGDVISIVLNDGHALDFELENTIDLKVEVSDGIDITELDVVVAINDLTGDDDPTDSVHEILTDEFANNAFTRFAILDISSDDVDKNTEEGTRYLFVGDSGDNEIHGSGSSANDNIIIGDNYDDVLIGNGGDDKLNGGEGDDAIIIQFDSSTGLFLSGSDDITNFNLGEDTLLIADEGGMNSLSQFLSLFVESGDGVRAALRFETVENVVKISGIQLRAVKGNDDNRVNIDFAHSDRNELDGDENGIRAALGIASDADLNNFYNSANHHLREAAFTVEHFQNLLSDHGGDSNKNALLITDIDNLPADFDVDGENVAPVLSVGPDEDATPNVTRIFGATSITSTFGSNDGWADDTDGVDEHIGRLVDGNKDINPNDYEEHFAPEDADGESITFTFAEDLYGVVFALYNNNKNDGDDDNIYDSTVEFLRDDDVVRTETLTSSDEHDNFNSPLAGDDSGNPDQDHVITATLEDNVLYDQVRLNFNGDEQFIREIEIYGYYDEDLFGYVEESTTGAIVDGVQLNIDDGDGDSFTGSDFTVYEEDGTESTRFDVIASGDHFKLRVTDGSKVDHEFEYTINLSVEVNDHVDLSNKVDVLLRTVDVAGSDDTNNPIPTTDFDPDDFSIHHANNDLDYSDSNTTRYFIYGEDNDTDVKTGNADDVIIGNEGFIGGDAGPHVRIDAGGGDDVFIFKYNSLTSRFGSAIDDRQHASHGTRIDNFVVGEDQILLADINPGVGITSLEDFFPLWVESFGHEGITISLFTHHTDDVQGIEIRATGSNRGHNERIVIYYQEDDQFSHNESNLRDKLAVPDGDDLSDYYDNNILKFKNDSVEDVARTVEALQNLFGENGLYITDVDSLNSGIAEYL